MLGTSKNWIIIALVEMFGGIPMRFTGATTQNNALNTHLPMLLPMFLSTCYSLFFIQDVFTSPPTVSLFQLKSYEFKIKFIKFFKNVFSDSSKPQDQSPFPKFGC